MADLPLLLQLAERADRLGERRLRVGAMELVEVDRLDAEPAQRGLAGALQVRGAAVTRPRRAALSRKAPQERLELAAAQPALRRDRDPVVRMQRLGDLELVHLRPVGICGVEEVDAELAARRSTAIEFSRSSGQPVTRGPVSRMQPKPSRCTSSSPPIRKVPVALRLDRRRRRADSLSILARAPSRRRARRPSPSSVAVTSSSSCSVEDLDAIRQSDRPEIVERGLEPPGDLRRSRARHADLVEGELDICLPAHRANGEPDRRPPRRDGGRPGTAGARAVAGSRAAGRSPARRWSDPGTASRRASARRCRRAGGSRRRRPRRASARAGRSSDVVQSILVETGRAPRARGRAARRPARTRRAPGRAPARSPLARASSTSRSTPIAVTTPDFARSHDPAASPGSALGRTLVRVLALEQLARVLADELDQRRDAERLADVVHVEDEHRDADEDEHERRHDRDPRDLAGAVAVDRSPRGARGSRARTSRRRGRSRAGSACPAGSAARSAARTGPSRAGRRPS